VAKVCSPIAQMRTGRVTSDRADEVTLARKGAKSRTRISDLRSNGTKARRRVTRGPDALVELERQLELRTRQLADAREKLAEALEQQTAAGEVLTGFDPYRPRAPSRKPSAIAESLRAEHSSAGVLGR
jgi:chromosome segregation ATPase